MFNKDQSNTCLFDYTGTAAHDSGEGIASVAGTTSLPYGKWARVRRQLSVFAVANLLATDYSVVLLRKHFQFHFQFSMHFNPVQQR